MAAALATAIAVAMSEAITVRVLVSYVAARPASLRTVSTVHVDEPPGWGTRGCTGTASTTVVVLQYWIPNLLLVFGDVSLLKRATANRSTYVRIVFFLPYVPILR